MSREAYESADLMTTEERVFSFLREKGALGATTDEIEAVTGMLHQTASPMVIKLRKDGRIRKTGEKRLTRSGRRAEVHAIPECAA